MEDLFALILQVSGDGYWYELVGHQSCNRVLSMTQQSRAIIQPAVNYPQ
jgi:hypothetical protein